MNASRLNGAAGYWARSDRQPDNTFPDGSPAWSPNGKKIASSSDRDGDGDPDIFKMNADGSHPKQLTHNTDTSREPQASPLEAPLGADETEPAQASRSVESPSQTTDWRIPG